MSNRNYVEDISKDVALQICPEIQQEYSGKQFSLAALQCWFV